MGQEAEGRKSSMELMEAWAPPPAGGHTDGAAPQENWMRGAHSRSCARSVRSWPLEKTRRSAAVVVRGGARVCTQNC
jgi:hypothetical protein